MEVLINFLSNELINLRKGIGAIFYQHFHCIDSKFEVYIKEFNKLLAVFCVFLLLIFKLPCLTMTIYSMLLRKKSIKWYKISLFKIKKV